jgi:hypothetical protein
MYDCSCKWLAEKFSNLCPVSIHVRHSDIWFVSFTVLNWNGEISIWTVYFSVQQLHKRKIINCVKGGFPLSILVFKPQLYQQVLWWKCIQLCRVNGRETWQNWSHIWTFMLKIPDTASITGTGFDCNCNDSDWKFVYSCTKFRQVQAIENGNYERTHFF